MTTKIRRTLIIVEVLHPESVDVDGMNLGELHEECRSGDSSLYWFESSTSSPLTTEELQERCVKHGTDVEFFGSDGEDEDKEETFDTADFQE